MNAEQRKHLAENEYAYLHNGLRCGFAGWRNSHASTISAMPGSFTCSWEKVAEVVKRRDRRFKPGELRIERSSWGGLEPTPDQFQTQEDCDRVSSSSERWW